MINTITVIHLDRDIVDLALVHFQRDQVWSRIVEEPGSRSHASHMEQAPNVSLGLDFDPRIEIAPDEYEIFENLAFRRPIQVRLFLVSCS